MRTEFQTVIGLEVHVQLSTLTKAFCSCRVSFGETPNSKVCPVCLGHPGGVLPVLNRKVFEYAIMVALAFGCEIQKKVKFDRKNYYYPDLPKNYQISQYDMPLAYRGHIAVRDDAGKEERIGITRIHIEEDAGKLIHDETSPYSFVDLNRAGTPLLEIVSEPEIHSPEIAYAYLTDLKRTIKYLGVSDCNMEEGSLRCDANISLRPKGETRLGTKSEIKNLNSFKAVRDALEYERKRQSKLLSEGKVVRQETRLWDENKGVTRSMRSKEQAHDYRYFPEPDLVPFEVSSDLVDSIRDNMIELPNDRALRFCDSYGLAEADVEVLIADKATADFFEAVLEEFNEPKSVANWIKGEIMRHMNERSCGVDELGIGPLAFAKVVRMVERSEISGLAAKDVILEVLKTGEDPSVIVERLSLKQVSDESDLSAVVEEVIAQHEKPVNDYKNGKDSALSFLIGQVMRKTKGKANPKIVGELFSKKIR